MVRYKINIQNQSLSLLWINGNEGKKVTTMTKMAQFEGVSLTRGFK